MASANRSRWLSEGAETLVLEIEEADADRHQEFHCDVLIVGSGYGGAVAAARLAGARAVAGGDAVSVFVLERGQEYLPGTFPATFAELPGHVRFGQQNGQAARGRAEGLFDLRLGDDVNVLLGNGLGGGSLINAAVMERADARALADARWPAGLSLDEGYAKAEAMLKPQTLPGSVPKLASLIATGAAMGANEARHARVAVAFTDQTTPAGVAMHKCLKCGDCVTGCNHQAKQSLDTNYLALAHANGARLFCGATVQRVSTHGRGFAVEFFFTDPAKARSDRARPYVLRARRVVLAAGTLGSTEILLRSRGAQLPIAEAALGSKFSTNGDLIAVAHRQKDAAPSCAHEGDAPADRNIGPTITGLVRLEQADNRRPLVIEEFAIPTPLRRLFGEVVATTDALHGLALTDRSLHTDTERMDDPLSVSDAALDHTPVYGMMGDDGADGAIAFVDGPAGADGQVGIVWPALRKRAVFTNQIAALRKAHETVGGRGGRVLPNPLWQVLPDAWPLPVPLGAPTTVHPLGGVPMGADRRFGVVDAIGRVFAVDGEPQATLPGLAVLDGSIVPVSLGINPALTIAALAEHAVPLLADEWGLALRDVDRLQNIPRPQRRNVSRPVAPQATSVSLHERMTGALVIDRRRFNAELVAHFAPANVPALRKLPRIVDQPEVELKLTDETGQAWRLRCTGRAELLVRERSDLQTRVARCIDLARRLLPVPEEHDPSRIPVGFVSLCSHLGAVRLIRYDWTVVDADDGAPIQAGQRLRLTKRIEFTETGNPWRQLSEGRLDRVDEGTVALGRLALDLAFFAEQLTPLVRIESQQDQPNALGDLAELALWVARIVLRIHFLTLAVPVFGILGGPGRQPPRARLPGELPDLVRTEWPVEPALPSDPRLGAPPRRLLTRYAPAGRPLGTARPVLLIHGYGAGGSTFAHPSIPSNLVQTLCATGREVWVLDLRTSIGLEQRVYWSFDDVAREDIPHAVATVLSRTGTQADGKVDVVAHCIGAAMFSVSVLGSPGLHLKIGSAVLSQVGPLLRMSAFNRFRGFVASYLKQFIGIEQFDVVAADGAATAALLTDALLATFPYPDDDREGERRQTAPEFARVRHRADGIFGQTMRLANIGDDTLAALADIYGWVMVEGLAQTIHYAREFLLTDAAGTNRVVAFAEIAQRLNFPLLMLHGRQNALFEWRGSYDTIRLLRQVIDDDNSLPMDPPPDPVIGAGSSRRLVVLDDYGHQDTLIGQRAHRDVFPHIVTFLDEFGRSPANKARGDPPLVAELPWMGPMLGHVERAADALSCRLLLRPPPARAATLALAYVPARRGANGWEFMIDAAVMAPFEDEGNDTDLEDAPVARAQVVRLAVARLADHEGFAVLTVHNDLPLRRVARIGVASRVRGLFAEPDQGLPDDIRAAVALALAGPPERVDLAVVHIDPAWVQAVQGAGQAPQDALTLALASCQYPPGLVDRLPAQRSLDRLVRHVADAPAAERPQALLLMGDQVYVDGTAGLFDPGSDATESAYRTNLTLPALRRATKALPTYPMLDDHEVQDDWEPEEPLTSAHAGALRSYRRHQHRLFDDRPQGPFDYSFAPAGLPVFMLDVRSTRQRRALRASEAAVLLDDAGIHAQADLADLVAALRGAPAEVPKFVVSSTTVFPFPLAALGGSGAERLGLDDWSAYPRSLFALLDAIRRERIANVVLLSGDRHMSSVSSLWLDTTGEPVEVVSVVSSGLYAPWPFVNSRRDEMLLDGAVQWQHGGRSLSGTMLTAVTGAGDGFSVVHVVRSTANGSTGGWQIDVRLDLADGVLRCGRVLGDNRDRRWQVR